MLVNNVVDDEVKKELEAQKEKVMFQIRTMAIKEKLKPVRPCKIRMLQNTRCFKIFNVVILKEGLAAKAPPMCLSVLRQVYHILCEGYRLQVYSSHTKKNIGFTNRLV